MRPSKFGLSSRLRERRWCVLLETKKGSALRRWRSLMALALGLGLFSAGVATKVSAADTVPGAAEEQSGSAAHPEGEAHPAAGGDHPAGEPHEGSHEPE